METEILELMVVNLPNFVGFFLLSFVLYIQNGRLIELLGAELKFQRERVKQLEQTEAPPYPIE